MKQSRTPILLFTAQDIGYRLVEFVAGRKDVNPLVVTRHTNRDAIYGYRSAIDACNKHRLSIIDTSKIDCTVERQIRAHRPEIILSAYYPMIIREDILDLPQRGSVNVHPGPLPYYRGRFPTPWYILNGESHFGVTVHLMDSGVDTGDILVQRKFEIFPDDTGHSLYRRAMDRAGDLLIENFDALLAGTLSPTPQRGFGSYYASIEKRFHIDWTMSRDAIERRIRVHAPPYFPAYAFHFNHMVSINRASSVELDGFSAQSCGLIMKTWPDGTFAVSCRDGCLLIEDYTVAPPLTPEQRNFHIQVGQRLE